MLLLRRLVQFLISIRKAVRPHRTDTMTVEGLCQNILGSDRLVAADVGAAMGLLPHWKFLNGVAHIYQIEPREDACAELSTANQKLGYSATRHVVCAAVSKTDGPRTLYVSNAPTGTSILKFDPSAHADCGDYVDPDYLFPIVEKAIVTQKLETILMRANEPRLDLIKLDIQGAELEALEGLSAAQRSQLLAVELEIGMHSFYPKEASFSAINDFLEGEGLEFFDVRVARVRRPRNGKEGQYEREVFSVDENSPTIAARLWEFDAIYFRKKSLLLASRDRSQIKRAVLAYASYNFFSEAHALVEKAMDVAIFDKAEGAKICQAIVDLHRVSQYRPWLANSRFWGAINRLGVRFAPRNAPRWCQHMYQGYPNG